jgi:formiminotetrahydrofolate cyclodeaminase
VINLIEDVSSKEPVPGGGAVSALSAALSASLCEMVTGLTIGKKFYNEYDNDIKDKINNISQKNREAKSIFLDLFEKDNNAFKSVMDAYKLPKETESEKQYRNDTIEQAFIKAMEIPLEVARKCKLLFEDIEFMAMYGNPNCITDLGVSSLQAISAINGAILNVRVNLLCIKGKININEVEEECRLIEEESNKLNTKIQNLVKSKL